VRYGLGKCFPFYLVYAAAQIGRCFAATYFLHLQGDLNLPVAFQTTRHHKSAMFTDMQASRHTELRCAPAATATRTYIQLTCKFFSFCSNVLAIRIRSILRANLQAKTLSSCAYCVMTRSSPVRGHFNHQLGLLARILLTFFCAVALVGATRPSLAHSKWSSNCGSQPLNGWIVVLYSPHGIKLHATINKPIAIRNFDEPLF
jgi:hypothetical protein